MKLRRLAGVILGLPLLVGDLRQHLMVENCRFDEDYGSDSKVACNAGEPPIKSGRNNPLEGIAAYSSIPAWKIMGQESGRLQSGDT